MENNESREVAMDERKALEMACVGYSYAVHEMEVAMDDIEMPKEVKQKLRSVLFNMSKSIALERRKAV